MQFLSFCMYVWLASFTSTQRGNSGVGVFVNNKHQQASRSQETPFPPTRTFDAFPVFRKDIETIAPVSYPPSWKAPFSTSIEESRETAIEAVHSYERSMCIYTDGSGHNGGVGAAAIHRRNDGTTVRRRFHLGRLDEHTVFEAEVTGIILALDIIQATAGPRTTKVTILLDNQAAITAAEKPKKQPGQYLLHCFHDALRKLMKEKPRLQIHLTWVPGHEGVELNEEVDKEAKRAAAGESSELGLDLHRVLSKHMPVSIAAAKATYKKQATADWEKEWKHAKRRKKMSRFDPSPPSSAVLKLYTDLPRRSCSVITQLRTGHIGLNSFLHRIGAAPSPKCDKCHVPETVEHFLLTCHKFKIQRTILRKRLCEAGLGLNMSSLLADHHNNRILASYVHATKRLSQYHDDIEIEDKHKKERKRTRNGNQN